PLSVSATSPTGRLEPMTVAEHFFGRGNKDHTDWVFFKGAGGSPLVLEPGENAIFSFNGAAGARYFEKGFNGSATYAVRAINKSEIQISRSPANNRSREVKFTIVGTDPSAGGGAGSNGNFSQYM